MRDGTPLRVRPYEQDATLGERYVSSSPHAAAVVESVHTAVLNRERASATNPPLGTAGAPEAESDPPEHVAAVSLPVVTSERDPANGDGVQHSDLPRVGEPMGVVALSGERGARGENTEHVRKSRLSRWQEQR